MDNTNVFVNEGDQVFFSHQQNLLYNLITNFKYLCRFFFSLQFYALFQGHQQVIVGRHCLFHNLFIFKGAIQWRS